MDSTGAPAVPAASAAPTRWRLGPRGSGRRDRRDDRGGRDERPGGPETHGNTPSINYDTEREEEVEGLGLVVRGNVGKVWTLSTLRQCTVW